MTDNATDTIDRTRFYLCDIGDGDDAFVVCGRCIVENDRDASLYELLPGLPGSVERTRECICCERDGHELRSLRARMERDDTSENEVKADE